MALFRSILNLQRWRGLQPRVLRAGRVEVHAGDSAPELTGMKSYQFSLVRIPGSTSSQVITIDAVVVSKSFIIWAPPTHFTARLTSSTEITLTTRQSTTSTKHGSFVVLESY